MAIGDLIFRMMGQEDPTKALLQALATQGAPAGMPQPVMDGAPPAGAAGAPATTPAAPGAPAPAPAAPIPNALKSPPDLTALYEKLMDRRDKNAMIDRGIGLIGAGFAQPSNRSNIINAFSGQQQEDPLSGVNNLLKLRATQVQLEHQAQLQQNLPAIAKKYGLDEDTARYLADAGKLDDVIATAEKGETSSADVKDYKYYLQQTQASGEKPLSFVEFQKAGGKAHTKFSLTPSFSMDEDGNVHSYQLSDAGGVTEIMGADGKPMVKPAVKVDVGTAYEMRNPYNGEVLKTIPKNNAEAENQKAVGTETGKATVAARQILPAQIASTEQANTILDSLERNDSLGSALGFTGSIARKIPGTTAYGIGQQIEQLKGKAFLDAFNTLKGGGAISDTEGEKATAAIARLDPNMSEDDFRSAMKELRSALNTVLSSMKAKASGTSLDTSSNSTASPTSGAPADAPQADPRLTQQKKALIMNDAVERAKRGVDKAALRNRMKQLGFTDDDLKDF